LRSGRISAGIRPPHQRDDSDDTGNNPPHPNSPLRRLQRKKFRRVNKFQS
jgi:hypothetical protein